MANHVLTKSNWASGNPTAADFADLDEKTVNAPNFADGGTYAPTAPVIIGGSGLQLTTTLTAAAITATSLTASATVQAEHLYSTDDLVVDDAATIGTLGVGGNATVGGTLGVSGLATLDSLSVTGAAGILGGLTVVGTITFTNTISGPTLDINGNGDISGNLVIGGTLGVTGTTTLGFLNVTTVAATGTVNGSLVSGTTGSFTGEIGCGSIACSGGATFAGSITGVTAITVAGTATVNSIALSGSGSILHTGSGDVQLNSGDFVAVNGDVRAAAGTVSGLHVAANATTGIVSGALLRSYGYIADGFQEFAAPSTSSPNVITAGCVWVSGALTSTNTYNFRLPPVGVQGVIVKIYFEEFDGGGQTVNINDRYDALVKSFSTADLGDGATIEMMYVGSDTWKWRRSVGPDNAV